MDSLRTDERLGGEGRQLQLYSRSSSPSGPAGCCLAWANFLRTGPRGLPLSFCSRPILPRPIGAAEGEVIGSSAAAVGRSSTRGAWRAAACGPLGLLAQVPLTHGVGRRVALASERVHWVVVCRTQLLQLRESVKPRQERGAMPITKVARAQWTWHAWHAWHAWRGLTAG